MYFQHVLDNGLQDNHHYHLKCLLITYLQYVENLIYPVELYMFMEDIL